MTKWLHRRLKISPLRGCVDIDDPSEGGNFTTYINVELARSTIRRLHLQRRLRHRVTQRKAR
ncbi:hypothetical protein ASPSYDRAFT_51170 [Aspergillus sydowii CBS 593.65]|uniref:Uncharacterized protein n=1 Tax=Aspergillus sydowii CBS 593.65 TaxID=1036612 RepID=A0A1L9T0W7_9EURO|nr:uncharacterized protein ASPSYDRAFT_51170 [Aspergillus sydowii CBS 593.65]OJJ53068.1 hypothetical protein ASPSYDRAFT_51170 [Aspergillus sydowii CBS 593.65]